MKCLGPTSKLVTIEETNVGVLNCGGKKKFLIRFWCAVTQGNPLTNLHGSVCWVKQTKFLQYVACQEKVICKSSFVRRGFLHF